MRVAEGFFKRATGYAYTETTFEKIDDKVTLELTPNEVITQDAYRKKIVTKHLPPDAGAALNWLKNRQPDKWRDKQEVEVTAKSGAVLKAWTAEDLDLYDQWKAQQRANENS